MKTWLIVREGHETQISKGLPREFKLRYWGRETYLARETTESDGIREKHDIWVMTRQAAIRNGFEAGSHDQT